MTKENRTIPITQIILDKEIYPRARVDPRRVSMFAENRDCRACWAGTQCSLKNCEIYRIR